MERKQWVMFKEGGAKASADPAQNSWGRGMASTRRDANVTPSRRQELAHVVRARRFVMHFLAAPAQIILLTLAINYVQGVEARSSVMQEGNANGVFLAASRGSAFTPSRPLRTSSRSESTCAIRSEPCSLKDQRPRLMEPSRVNAMPHHRDTSTWISARESAAQAWGFKQFRDK